MAGFSLRGLFSGFMRASRREKAIQIQIGGSHQERYIRFHRMIDAPGDRHHRIIHQPVRSLDEGAVARQVEFNISLFHAHMGQLKIEISSREQAVEPTFPRSRVGDIDI